MKLKTKLIIAFLAIAIASTGIGMGVAVWATKDSFDQYVQSQTEIDAGRWQEVAANYYNRYNTLEGIQEAVHVPMGRRMGQHRDRQGGGESGELVVSQRTLIVDNENVIVLDTANNHLGQQLSSQQLEGSEPILVHGQEVGRLLIEVKPPSGVITLEEKFLQSVYSGFGWSAAVASLLAIGLGLIFATRLVNPIEHLTGVVKKMSGQALKHRAQVTTTDEIGTLATNFNQMADELEKNLQLKGQLVADVSHELRTPITILRGNFESIQAGVKEPTPELIVSMNDEVIRLSRLIADLQQLSMLDFGSLKMNKQKVDLKELIDKTVHSFAQEAEDKGIDIEVIAEQPAQVHLDHDRIKQVLINLVSNALKYSQEKSKIQIDLSSSQDSTAVRIVDWGSGISDADLENVFERFYRTDQARNRQHGGMGLGLAIAKGIVEAHGGRMWAEKNEPSGSIFAFELPKN